MIWKPAGWSYSGPGKLSAHFLTNTNVQDKGLAHLAPLTQLKELGLAQTEIKGASLAPFVNLQFLDLTDTPFGDAGTAGRSGYLYGPFGAAARRQ